MKPCKECGQPTKLLVVVSVDLRKYEPLCAKCGAAIRQKGAAR